MLKSIIICSLFLSCLVAQGQGKKLRDLSFKQSSIEFANANREYDDRKNGYTPLADSIILTQLYDILTTNPNLIIEVGGHCDSVEDSSFASQRATRVVELLIGKGIAKDRLVIKSYAADDPAFKPELFKHLESKQEIDAAHQKNRRVTFKIISIDYKPAEE